MAEFLVRVQSLRKICVSNYAEIVRDNGNRPVNHSQCTETRYFFRADCHPPLRKTRCFIPYTIALRLNAAVVDFLFAV